MPVLLTLGHGYSAAALAATLPDWRRLGTTRSPERAAAMRAAGVAPLDWADAAAVDAAIAAASHILVSLPPDADGDPVLARHRPALAAARPAWLGYLSTTGVYGDRAGGWVDEASPLAPIGERGRRRVAAEAAWAATGLPVHHFRLAGIYGPGRSALDELREGTARRTVKPGHAFSRIHRDDIALAVFAAMRQHRAPGLRVLHLVDDEPAESAAVVEGAARLLGVEPPPAMPFEQALPRMSPMARSFWRENRRVANAATKRALGIASWRHPTWREGLAAILREERGEGPA
jgi:nucleoside-diphosphate-sugar epimerase